MIFEWSLDENLFWKENLDEWKCFIFLKRHRQFYCTINVNNNFLPSNRCEPWVPRQVTDKTVHRHVTWRHFTDKVWDSSGPDTFEDSSPTNKCLWNFKIKKNNICARKYLWRKEDICMIFPIILSGQWVYMVCLALSFVFTNTFRDQNSLPYLS